MERLSDDFFHQKAIKHLHPSRARCEMRSKGYEEASKSSNGSPSQFIHAILKHLAWGSLLIPLKRAGLLTGCFWLMAGLLAGWQTKIIHVAICRCS